MHLDACVDGRNFNGSSAVAVMADRTAYDVRYSCLQTVVWDSRGQREYLLIYSFKLKCAFDPCQCFIRTLCFLSAFSPSVDICCILCLKK